MKKIFIACIAATMAFFSCDHKASISNSNKFSDPEIIRISQLTDERKGNALLEYFKSPNPIYRAEAAMAFASIQDTLLIDELTVLLNDPDSSVSTACAYALGQCGNALAIEKLKARFGDGTSDNVGGAILEAVGKITAKQITSNPTYNFNADIEFLTGITFRSESERLGWAKAAMWLHAAGLIDTRLMNRMPFVLQRTEAASRVACAHAMARFKDATWFSEEKNKKYVLAWCGSERNGEVRMVQMSLLAKINDEDAKKVLMGYLLSGSQEQIVKVSALRAAAKMNTIKASEILPVLDDLDEYVVIECVQALSVKDAKEVLDIIGEKCNKRIPEIRALSMRLAVEQGDASRAADIRESFFNATDTYARAHYARAMGVDATLAKDVFDYLIAEKEFVVKSALMEAFIEMNPAKSNQFVTDLLTVFRQGDIGMQAQVATALRDKKFNDGIQEDIRAAFEDALTKLTLPREIETYNEVIRTLNTISDQKREEKKLDFNHPIDWKKVAGISVKQQAKVTTSQGTFTIDLKVEDAPGSVAMFVQLAEEGFFNGKFFHRVIPNFVIQGGCPRGDGMGGLDYTVRSEFRLHDYATGAVGLASSGKDTESCQWFVTHCPTPSLEGRYTIFGYVSSGMDVVKKILVGDKIQAVEII